MANQERVLEFINIWNSGIGVETIMETLNMSRTVVMAKARKYRSRGVEMMVYPRKPHAHNFRVSGDASKVKTIKMPDERMAEIWNTSGTAGEAAGRCGTTKVTIYKWAAAYKMKGGKLKRFSGAAAAAKVFKPVGEEYAQRRREARELNGNGWISEENEAQRREWYPEENNDFV